jgi:D-alanyl-D-alanine carboxypeptidase
LKITKNVWKNTNVLLAKGWEGVKTGQTGSAGSCLSSLKNDVFIVVLNCKDNDARFY